MNYSKRTGLWRVQLKTMLSNAVVLWRAKSEVHCTRIDFHVYKAKLVVEYCAFPEDNDSFILVERSLIPFTWTFWWANTIKSLGRASTKYSSCNSIEISKAICLNLRKCWKEVAKVSNPKANNLVLSGDYSTDREKLIPMLTQLNTMWSAHLAWVEGSKFKFKMEKKEWWQIQKDQCWVEPNMRVFDKNQKDKVLALDIRWIGQTKQVAAKYVCLKEEWITLSVRY